MTSDAKSCEFYVEDVCSSRRYVVKLKPQDLIRVKCRTIRRHLTTAAGFPYLAHEFSLYGGYPNPFLLHDDDVGPSFQLRSGSVLHLHPKEIASNTKIHTDPQSGISPLGNMMEEEDEDALLSGLNGRQRQLQSRLLNEFRRSVSAERSPSPPPLAPVSAQFNNGSSGQMSKSIAVPLACSSNDASASLIAVANQMLERPNQVRNTSTASTHSSHGTWTDYLQTQRIHKEHRGPSYDESPYPYQQTDSSVSPQLLGTTTVDDEDSLESFVVGGSMKPRKYKEAQAASTKSNVVEASAAVPLVSAFGVQERSPNANSSVDQQLHGDLEKLLSLAISLQSAKAAAQRDIDDLSKRLKETESQLETAVLRGEALTRHAIAELTQQIGSKYVRSQAEFDTIVRNFSRHKEDQLTIDRLETARIDLIAELDEERHKRRQLQQQLEDHKGNIRVLLRVRPLISRAMSASSRTTSHFSLFPSDSTVTVDSHKNTICIVSPTSGTRTFDFYRVFDENASQMDVFREVSPLIQCAVDGTNVAVLAYGQTGSGKTHTIIGDVEGWPRQNAGVIPQAMQELFSLFVTRSSGSSVLSACVMCSLVEIYNEQLIDLLSSGISAINELPDKFEGTVLQSSPPCRHQVRSAEEAIHLVLRGIASRRVFATKQNSQSSRSHLIFTVFIASRDSKGKESKLVFADLAGSERVSNSQSTGDRLREAQYINKSLSALGDVVASLSSAEGEDPSVRERHIPYRNSKLTLALQDCIGGSSKTLLVACIAPFEQADDHDRTSPPCSTSRRVTNLHETVSTLQFASRVRLVRNGTKMTSVKPAMKVAPSISINAAATPSVKNGSQPLRAAAVNQQQHRSSSCTSRKALSSGIIPMKF